MWLILLICIVNTQPSRFETELDNIPQIIEKTYHERGPNYEKRFKCYDSKFNYQVEDFFCQTNDFIIDSTIYCGAAIAGQGWPQAVFDGTNYFVIWTDERRSVPGDAKNDVFGTRVSPEGEILDPNNIFISFTNSGGSVMIGMFPAVAYGAGVYLCVHEDYDWGSGIWDLWGVRVDTAGNVLDPNRIQITNRPTSEGMPRVAFDGTNFLVVWQDHTSAPENQDIYGARVTPEGVVLDPNGFPIHSASYKTYYCDVAFDGTNYLVTWTDCRNSPHWLIYGARVTPDATVLDPGFAICDLPEAHGCFPKIAFGAENYLVVWEDQRQGVDKVYGARVTPEAQVLDPNGINISPSMQYTVFPSVTFDGQNYAAFWAIQYTGGSYGCHGARVSPEGTLLDPTAITIENISPAYVTGASSDGVNSFCVWNEDRFSGSSESDIWGSRMNQSGTVLDTNGFLVSTQVNIQELSSIAYDNQNYFVTWDEHRNSYDIYGKFVGSAGGPIGSLIPVSTKNQDEAWPCVAFGDSNYLAVWHALANTWDIFGTRVSQSGEILDPYGIGIGAWAADQGYPSVAFDEENWLVVWDDSRNDAGDIYGARINAQGQNLDPFHIPISTANNDQWFPSISFDGTNYFVVWQDWRAGNFAVYGARVTPQGAVLDPDGIFISNTNVPPAYELVLPKICFSGSQYLVVWMDWRNSNYDVYGTRVTTDGVVLDPGGIPICTYSYDQGIPNVTFDGENYIVLWEDARSQETWDIYGAIVDTSGAIIDSFIVTDEGVNERYPTLAKGLFDHALFTYAKHASQPYDVFRIYGQYYPPMGIEEARISNPRTLNLQVFPNPFGDLAQINYSLPYPAQVSLKLYAVDGRLIGTLINDTKEAGNYWLKYNSKNLPSGVYFLNLSAGNHQVTSKLIKGL
jgi:hypothetical protein